MRCTFVATLSIVCAPAVLPAQSRFVITDTRVFDGRHVSEHRSVLVENGRISRIGGSDLKPPANAEVIDGRGRTLLPGLIDAHVHLSDGVEADLRQAIALGVTTVLDMFTGAARFERIKAARAADAPDRADVRTAGVGATAPGGHPSQMGGPPFPTVADSAAAAAFVDERFREGSDFLKIIYDNLPARGPLPMLSRGALRALVAAAHAQNRLAVVHISTEEQAVAAIDAGADGLAHMFSAATPSTRFVDVVVQRKAFIIPTLGILLAMCGESTGPEILADTLLAPYIRPNWRGVLGMTFTSVGGLLSCGGTQATLKELARKGVRILTGTDSPVPGQTYGASIHGEMSALVSAGLTPTQALTAATSAAAESFRLTDRGFIRPGLRADLLLVDGDPTRDIRATRRIVGVWKQGVRVNRLVYSVNQDR
jgi:imidazolonepropionase-like amidohydrolase